MKLSKTALAPFLLAFVMAAHAQDASVPTDSMLIDIVTTAMQQSTGQIITMATKWLSLFMMAQYAITNYKLLFAGAEIDAVLAKSCGSVLWFCFCWYAMNEGPAFINAVGNQFFSDFAPNLPSPSSIILTIIGTVTALSVLAGAVGVVSNVFGQEILVLALLVFGIGMFLAIKLFLLQLELGIVVMMAPFNFSFLGLNALKENGIAPLKSLMTLMFRIVLYGIIFAAFSHVANATAIVGQKYAGGDLNSIQSLITSGATFIKLLISCLVAYVVLFGLLFKSDSIASGLASGSTNLGTADVAQAAAAGAALGAVAASGGAALGMGKVPQLMSDFMNKAFGGGDGVGVSNATPDLGMGGVGTPPSRTSDAPGMSRTASSDAGGTASSGMGGGDAEGGQTASGATSANDSTATGSSASSTPGGNTTSAAFEGVPNRLPEDVAAESRKAERDAAREQRRQARAGGSAENAAIGGTGTAPIASGKKFGDHLSNLGHHVSQERATVSASINLHHD